jgi:peptide/nickel transport system permease protein
MLTTVAGTPPGGTKPGANAKREAPYAPDAPPSLDHPPRDEPPRGRRAGWLARAAATRLAAAAATTVILITAAFLVAHVMPGGPAYSILQLRSTPAGVAAVDLQLGLDVPVWRQYLVWWAHLLQGDLGRSYLLNRPVAGLLAEYQLRTAVLYGSGLALGTLLAIGGGLLHGMWRRDWRGHGLAALELSLYALPSFFVGTALMAVFATGLGWLPAGGAYDMRVPHPGFGDALRHLALPVCTVALATYAGLAPYFAQSIDAELHAAYALTARAKGLSPWGVALRHVLRNALRPLVTMLGLSFPALIAGSVVVESVFSFPGLGWLLWRSAIAHDYPVLIGIVLLVGLATILGNLAAELINTWLDPRALYV